MGFMTVRDNAIWAKHIEGDDRIVDTVLALEQNAPVTLRVDGTPLRCVKMRDGSDGRPTPGLRPADSEAKQFWDSLQERRGERVRVELDEADGSDDMAASLTMLLSEWDSPEDCKAYDGL